MKQYKVVVRNMEQMYPGLDIVSFSFSSCLQALENGMDFNFVRKISLQERNGFVNPKGLYHLQEKKRKKHSVKKTFSHVYIA